MLAFAVELKKPVVIRYPRGGEDKEPFEKHENIEEGKAEILKEGKDISILTIGKTVARGIKIAKKLQNINIDAEVINVRFLKPLDVETIKKSISKTKKVVTIEDGTIINGLGTAIKELVIDNHMEDVEVKAYAYPDKFIQHGSVDELEKIYGLDKDTIVEDIQKHIVDKSTEEKIDGKNELREQQNSNKEEKINENKGEQAEKKENIKKNKHKNKKHKKRNIRAI